jgi:hypothetical protein
VTHGIAYAHSAYVLCAVPARDGWHARAMLGECSVAQAEGPTAEAALERLKRALDRLPRQPAPGIPSRASSQASN